MNLSQVEFARLLGTSQVVISRWETENCVISKAYRELIKLKTGYEINETGPVGINR